MFQHILFLFITFLIYKYFYRGYYPYLPTLPIYSDNDKEAKLVLDSMKTITDEELEVFHKTNYAGVAPVFKPYVEEDMETLVDMSHKQNSTIMFFKRVINRARPAQINASIKPINIDTAKTPAYPAGHAYQAYLLALKLSKKYPDKKDIFYKLAYQCDIARVKAGLHYPSDGKFAKWLVHAIN